MTRNAFCRLLMRFPEWSKPLPVLASGCGLQRRSKMQVTTEVGERYEFVLKRALLIYEDQVSKREYFATVHDVQQGSEAQPPRLGSGSMLTTSFLEQLCHRLELKTKAILLPENIL